MSNIYYNHYITETLGLTRSLIIKSESFISGLNDYIIDLGYTLSDDPKTWKYYLNLAGEPHDLDQVLNIVSLDTQTTIPFSKASLLANPKTKREYQVGTRLYNDLVARYPEEETLIRGIVDPIDPDTAIAALDHQILHYNPKFIESNETNLIENLQTLLYGHLNRWDNPSFNVVDDLYNASYFSILFFNLPGWILNLRLANSKTRFAHSYHIREYLKSNGRLDLQLDYLTKSQQLFLYRNLLYINRNVGKTETFEWVSDKILTERGLGLAQYDIQHNLSGLLEFNKPEVRLHREGLNKYHVTFRDESFSPEEVLYKQRVLARDNITQESKFLLNELPRIENSIKNELKTKLLETTAIDKFESGVIIRSEFFFSHWVYWSLTGRYKNIDTLTHPRTNASMRVSSLDSVILFFYLVNRSYGVNLTTLPKLSLRTIRRPGSFTKVDFSKIADLTRVSPKALDYALQQSNPNTFVSNPLDFSRTANALYLEFYNHRETYSLEENIQDRGHTQAVMDHLYMNYEVDLLNGTTYEDWLDSKSLDLINLERTEYQILADEIITKFLGLNLLGSYSLYDIQRAMLTVMRQLSSYTVQYAQEINLKPIISWDWPTVRLNNILQNEKSHEAVNVPKDIVINAKPKYYGRVQNNFNEIVLYDHSIRGYGTVPLNLNDTMRSVMKETISVRIQLAQTRINSVVVTEL